VWIYRLYYVVLTKLTLTKWASGLKGFLQRNCNLKIIRLIMTITVCDKKSHTIGDTLVLPATVKTAEIRRGEQCHNKL